VELGILSGAAISCSQLRFSYGTRLILDGIDFVAHAGDIHAILGANGAGKSTLLRILLGLEQPGSGEVLIFDQPLATMDAKARASVGYVPEQSALYEELTGFENVEYFLAMQPELTRLSRADIEKSLQQAGLPARAWNERASTYSKGMRQKVMIAAAIARAEAAAKLSNSASNHASAGQTKPVILFDEPNSGLDPAASIELDTLLLKLKADGVTVIIVTHDLASISALQPKVWFLSNAQLRALDAEDLSLQGLRALYTSDIATNADTASITR
jgi:ABC-2 type transport system ATP-binding protein